MKRFGRALVVALGIAVLASVVSLVPQKNATATGGAPVTVINTATNPVPITGNVNATVSGSVGVNNFPATQNVSVTNPYIPVSGNVGVSGSVPVVNVTGRFGSLPLVTLDALDSPSQPFQTNLCSTGLPDNGCGIPAIPSSFIVPNDAQGNPQRLVIEYVSGDCVISPPNETAVQLFLTTTAGGNFGEHSFPLVNTGSSVASNSTSLTFGQRTKIYADPGSEVSFSVQPFPSIPRAAHCFGAISGYLISPTL